MYGVLSFLPRYCFLPCPVESEGFLKKKHISKKTSNKYPYNYVAIVHINTVLTHIVSHYQNSTIVNYYLSTNSLGFAINFNYSTLLNSATYATLTGVSDSKL